MSEPMRPKRSGCCARVASGQAAVAPTPPITLMKSRRLIAPPEPAPAFDDYSKEMRATEWGLMVSLHSNNPEPRISQMGQKANRSLPIARQLSPAPDMPPYLLRAAMCQGTKSLRDSQRPRRLTATLSPGARSWVAGEAPCLEDRGVSNLSLKTGVAYDNQGYHPAASAYDRRYECAQALCWHAEGPHPQLQAVRGVSEAITRHGYMRGYPRLPAASGRHGDEHL